MKRIVCEVSMIFTEWCGENSIIDAKSKTSLFGNGTALPRYIWFPSRHIHILHYFDHFGQCMEIFILIFNNAYHTLIESKKL